MSQHFHTLHHCNQSELMLSFTSLPVDDKNDDDDDDNDSGISNDNDDEPVDYMV